MVLHEAPLVILSFIRVPVGFQESVVIRLVSHLFVVVFSSFFLFVSELSRERSAAAKIGVTGY